MIWTCFNLKSTSQPPRTRTPRSQYFRETVNTKTRAQINKGSKHKPNYKQSLNLGRMEIAHTLFFLRWQQWARSSRSRHGNHLPNEVQLSTQAKMRHGSPDPLHCNCHAITLEKKKCHIAKHVPGQVLSHPASVSGPWICRWCGLRHRNGFNNGHGGCVMAASICSCCGCSNNFWPELKYLVNGLYKEHRIIQ